MTMLDSPAGAVEKRGAHDPLPGTVMTVTGPLPADELGLTLPHEHLISDFTTPRDTVDGWRAVGRERPTAANARRIYEAALTIELLGDVGLGAPNRDNWLLDEEERARHELEDYARAGGTTIVDLTSVGLGRDPGALRRLAEATGVHIIMGAGWYGSAWSPELAGRAVEDLAEEIVRDLTVGVDGVRAGIIGEIGALDPAGEADRTLLRAVARAACTTGAPVSIDRSPEPGVELAVLDLLAAEGVDPGRIAVGHCDGLALQRELLLGLLQRGVYLQFDLLGSIPSVLTEVADHDVAVAVVELAASGFADRILLSQDVSRKIDLTSFGGGGYGFIAEQFVPYLRGLGADETLVQTLTVRNPARLLSLAD